MYIIKLVDPTMSWGYCEKGNITCSGKRGWFYEDSVFSTEEEANQYIKTLLSSGWYRDDITERNFSIVEVKQHGGHGKAWYTDEYFKEIQDKY